MTKVKIDLYHVKTKCYTTFDFCFIKTTGWTFAERVSLLFYSMLYFALDEDLDHI